MTVDETMFAYELYLLISNNLFPVKKRSTYFLLEYYYFSLSTTSGAKHKTVEYIDLT